MLELHNLNNQGYLYQQLQIDQRDELETKTLVVLNSKENTVMVTLGWSLKKLVQGVYLVEI